MESGNRSSVMDLSVADLGMTANVLEQSDCWVFFLLLGLPSMGLQFVTSYEYTSLPTYLLTLLPAYRQLTQFNFCLLQEVSLL